MNNPSEKKSNVPEEKEVPFIKRTSSGMIELPQEEQRPQRGVLQNITFYALPLLSLLVFFGLLILGTIPSVRGIFDQRSQVGEKQELISKLDKQISALEELKRRESEYDSDLAIIDSIVP